MDAPVFTIGEYEDPIALYDEVKIEAGEGIIITRDDAHNSLIISAT